ncbi:MAG: hypothetical protein NTX25_17080, partial [Proteobacteria bacterium]|nr:hypothetical protein [Pseudomonadota bacterium]
TVWRSMGQTIDAQNSPSHFIDLDYILKKGPLPLASEMPKTLSAYRYELSQNCSKKELSCAPGADEAAKLSKAGHAPFRIQNLSHELTEIFLSLKKLENEPKASQENRQALIDKALLYTGVLAHFVGDLSNPHHTSQDYDGWNSDQGGLHGYFESDMVDIQDLSLEAAIYNKAQKDQAAGKIFAKTQQDILTMTWALVLDSHSRLDTLLELDRQQSLVKKSEASKHQRAIRKAPVLVAAQYRDFLLERLALGADALAAIWTAAWQAGGKPKFEGYQSYNYPIRPDFIPLAYLPEPTLAK